MRLGGNMAIPYCQTNSALDEEGSQFEEAMKDLESWKVRGKVQNTDIISTPECPFHKIFHSRWNPTFRFILELSSG